jgi:hypothetical protein
MNDETQLINFSTYLTIIACLYAAEVYWLLYRTPFFNF